MDRNITLGRNLASFATIKYQQINATMHRICPVKKPSRPSASNFKYLLMFLELEAQGGRDETYKVVPRKLYVGLSKEV